MPSKLLPFSLADNYSDKTTHGNYSLPPCTQDHIVIFFLRQGNVSTRIGKQRFQMESDQCICIMPGIEYVFCSIDPTRPFFYDAIHIHSEYLHHDDPVFLPFFEQLKARKSSITYVVSNATSDGESILHYLTEVVSLLKSQPDGYLIGCKGYIELIFFKLFSMVEVPQAIVANSDTIQETISYIEANYMNKISIDVLARLCCMSKYHFIRCFYHTTGQTPVEYINSYRIKMACRLLRQKPEEKIITITLAVGFNDLSNFNRTFKRVIGQTPVEYRRDALRRAQYNQNSIFYEECATNVPFYSFMP